MQSLSNPLSFVIGTSAWAARAPRQQPIRTKPFYIVIHHTGVHASSKGTIDGAEELARAIQRDHMARGWIDSGHNFLITTGGFTLEGRHGSVAALLQKQCVRSAHTIGANDSPGIEAEGNFTETTMTTAQWNALVRLCTVLCTLTKMDPRQIRAHRQFDATECPGDWLFSQLPRLRTQVRRQLNMGSSKQPKTS